MGKQWTEEAMERQTLTVEEAARLLGVGRSTAYLAVRRGDLPVIRIGRRYVVPRLALERLLDGEHTDADNYRPH
jgi:excisionase family DNA binding protein